MPVIVIIVILIILMFVGCFDRMLATRRADGRSGMKGSDVESVERRPDDGGRLDDGLTDGNRDQVASNLQFFTQSARRADATGNPVALFADHDAGAGQ